MQKTANGVRGSFSSFSSFQVKNLPAQDDEKLTEVKTQLPAKVGVAKVKPVPEKFVEIGCVSQEGLFHENEDRMSYGINLNDHIDGFVAVFDGHGGEECADYVAGVMSQHLVKHFDSDKTWAEGEDTMKTMFHDIEEEFVNVAVEEDDTSGSCATVVLVRKEEALVANIGDCKAIAVVDVNDKSDSYETLTGDHRADAPDESERINLAGGSVVDGRVCNLQPSRSFGDIDVKEIVGDGVVIPTPEVSRIKIKPGGFMIVATDGLWDSVDTDSVVQCAKETLKATNFNAEAAAEELVELAVEYKSTDDITVAVLVWSS